jgi:hypothetical protein
MRVPVRLLPGLLLLAAPAFALDGGTPISASQPLSRSAVAIQAVNPQPDGSARFSECTGALIAPDLVLTAAHCFDEVKTPEHVAVFFFEGSKVVPTVVPVAAIARHPRHTKGRTPQPGDIETAQKEIASNLAVLRLKAPAPSTQAVIKLDPMAAPDVLTVAGAGIAGPGGRSGTLKTAALANIYHTKSGPKLALATPGKGQVCRGDSGGPVVTASGALWGVTGAITRATKGCSQRMVIVPVDLQDPAVADMIRMARKP